jgi:hypothetical protein
MTGAASPAVNHSSTVPSYVPGMDETQTLAARALRELLDDPDRDDWDELLAPPHIDGMLCPVAPYPRSGEISGSRQGGLILASSNRSRSARSARMRVSSIWLAGVGRHIGPTGKVGFHAAYNGVTLEQSGFANAFIGAYLNELHLCAR